MIRGAPGREKRIVRGARRQAVRTPRLFLLCDLDGLNVLHQVVDSHVATVNVLFDLMEDGTPDGHFARAVRGDYVVAGDDSADAIRWEFAVVHLRQDGEIGDRRFQSGGGGTVAFGILAVAGGAIGAKKIGTVDGADELLKLFVRVAALIGLARRPAAWRKARVPRLGLPASWSETYGARSACQRALAFWMPKIEMREASVRGERYHFALTGAKSV